ncbi:YbaN family protein [Bowmanella denitrificans]
MNLLWRLLAVAFVVIGLIGVVVPGLPTVVFLLIAAWCAGKGWPALEIWLLNHPRYGLPIRNWRQFGSVPRKAKVLATVMISCSALLLWFFSLHLYLNVAISIVLVAVMLWLWSRPELSLDR